MQLQQCRVKGVYDPAQILAGQGSVQRFPILALRRYQLIPQQPRLMARSMGSAVTPPQSEPQARPPYATPVRDPYEPQTDRIGQHRQNPHNRPAPSPTG